MAALGVRVPRARYLRRRKAERGHRRSRLRRLNRWLDARADTGANGGIGDTAAAGASVTGTNATETINHTSHGFVDGSGPHIIAAATMPTGLDTLRPYFLNVTGAGTYTLSRDHFQALGGAGGPEPFTTDGTTVTSAVGATNWCFFAYLKSRVHPLTIQAATDVDNLKL